MMRIDVPATSANLGSGFDSLGIALTKCNRVWMEEWDAVDIASLDDTVVPTDSSNLIYWAAERLFEECGHKLPGLRIRQENNIPMARGLGSSSACIVAGILGANRMLGNPLSQKDLIRMLPKSRGTRITPLRRFPAGWWPRPWRASACTASVCRYRIKSALPFWFPHLN